MEVKPVSTVRRSLTGAPAMTDGDDIRQRMGRYGEQVVELLTTSRHKLADEGSYFVATNPTVGTGLAYPVTTVFSGTTAMFYLRNGATAGDMAAKRVYLDYIKIVVTVVPATTTVSGYAGVLDPGVARAAKSIQSGTLSNAAAITGVAPNSDMSSASVLDTFWAQSGGTALVLSAASGSAKTVTRGNLGGLPILGDELMIQFGQSDVGSYGATAVASRKVTQAAPVVIGPQASYAFHMFFTANATTGLSYEFEVGWWER